MLKYPLSHRSETQRLPYIDVVHTGGRKDSSSSSSSPTPSPNEETTTHQSLRRSPQRRDNLSPGMNTFAMFPGGRGQERDSGRESRSNNGEVEEDYKENKNQNNRWGFNPPNLQGVWSNARKFLLSPPVRLTPPIVPDYGRGLPKWQLRMPTRLGI